MTRIQNWRFTGSVRYREGGGILMSIPLGRCEVELTEFDATIGWADGSMRGAAAVSLGQYARWLSVGWLRAD